MNNIEIAIKIIEELKETNDRINEICEEINKENSK